MRYPDDPDLHSNLAPACPVDLGTVLSVRIVWGKDGFPIRSVVGRGYTRPTGSFPSVKARRTFPVDALGQRDYCHLCEADAEVVDYCTEPFRVEIATSLHNLVYFPDVAVLRADGSIHIVEVKKSKTEVDRDPLYRAKIDLSALSFKSEGWTFEILDHVDIRSGPRLPNARAICQSRATRVTAGNRMALMEAIDVRGGSIAFGEAAALLGNGDNPECTLGTAILHALIVRRFVEVDLSRPLTMFSELRIAPPIDNSLLEATAHLRRD